MGAAGPVILGDGGVDREMRRVEEFSRVVEMVIGDVREKQCVAAALCAPAGSDEVGLEAPA